MTISSGPFHTILDLYRLNGREFGFCVVNELPRSYALVKDYGRVMGHGDRQEWRSHDPESVGLYEAIRLGLGYRVDRYAFNTNRRVGIDLIIIDTGDKGWARYQP